MKKILFFVAAALTLASCEKDPKVNDEPGGNGGTPSTEESISIDPKSKAFENIGGTVDVKVTSSSDWTLVKPGNCDWITPSAVSGKNGETVKFTAKKNESTAEQKAEFTFKCGKASTKFSVSIAAAEPVEEPYLTSDNTSFELDENGGTIDITVSTNVEYTYNAADAWVSHKGTNGNVESFTVEALPDGTDTRSTTILFSKKDADTPNFTVTVSQKREQSQGGGDDEVLITTAGYFNSTRAYPTWEGNATPFENMSAFTFEALVNHEGSWTQTLNTIIGIDGYFMVRLGDEGIGKNEIQVCCTKGNGEEKLNSGVQLESDTWYHIAVTFNSGDVKLYVNGELKGEMTVSGTSTLSFNRQHTEETGGWGATRCFWVGFSCGASRCWKGMMSEVRIWNKALTESDLNAQNHFYQVSPTSSGLVAYWKFNEGQGNVVEDQTSNGNDLYCQINVKNDPPNTSTADDGMEWKTVSLPETR